MAHLAPPQGPQPAAAGEVVLQAEGEPAQQGMGEGEGEDEAQPLDELGGGLVVPMAAAAEAAEAQPSEPAAAPRRRLLRQALNGLGGDLQGCTTLPGRLPLALS